MRFILKSPLDITRGRFNMYYMLPPCTRHACITISIDYNNTYDTLMCTKDTCKTRKGGIYEI